MTLLHHRADGPASAPPLLLGPSLGTSYALWDAVAPELSPTHRVIRWDLPGHGGSPAGLLSPKATVADLAGLVLTLADSLGIERFAYAGVSLGGAVGLHLAVHHPDRVTSLAAICSSAHFGGSAPWEERAERVRREGLAGLADTADARWFTTGYTVPRLVRDHREADPASYAACCDALAAFDLRDLLDRITAPTLLVAGRADKLMESVRSLAATLIANSPTSILRTKRLLCAYAEAELDRDLGIAIEENAHIRSTADFREGLSSFLEKRKPIWKSV